MFDSLKVDTLTGDLAIVDFINGTQFKWFIFKSACFLCFFR